MLYRYLSPVLCLAWCAAALPAVAAPAEPALVLKPSPGVNLRPLGDPAAARAAAPRAVVVPAVASVASTVHRGDLVRVLLVADHETALSSPTTARIKSLNATTGGAFGAGQVLVSFDCEEPVARHRMAQAELAGAQETLDARVRMQGLEQASEVEVALAASAVAKARGQVELHRAQISQCTIKAPWAGRVAKVHVRNYMSVTPGQPLLDLVKSGPLRLKLNLPSRLVSRVADGTLLDVAIDETGKTYQARVRAVNSRVDPVSQTVEIEASITRSHAELLPGMSGAAHLGSLR